MKEAAKFHESTLIGGPLVQLEVEGWDWKKNRGGYHQHSDFFSVHWEAQVRDPLNIRLHIEAPRREVDTFLNGMKQQMVKVILDSSLESSVLQHGYGFKLGSKIKEKAIQGNKSTEPFRVILAATQQGGDLKAQMQKVHEAVWPDVLNVIGGFKAILDAHFA